MTDRRSFLRGTSVLMAHASFPQVLATFLAGCAAAPPTERKPVFFSREDMTRLAILVDMILPATDTPAASAASTPEFIDAAMSACATERQQSTFRAGLAALVTEGFDAMDAQARIALLQRRAAADIQRPYDESFFKILKDYTLTGYFHSEIGATQALAYERVPGGFQGDIALSPGQKAWAI
jgi:Gluconate 2-dehydrogenase subunit 3